MLFKETMRKELGTNPKAYIQETVERIDKIILALDSSSYRGPKIERSAVQRETRSSHAKNLVRTDRDDVTDERLFLVLDKKQFVRVISFLMVNIKVGQKAVYERTFTTKDIETFAELSGDKGSHHIHPDAQGRIMVQGLLTASVPTKLGGDLDYIAREFNLEFIRPVFAGDTVRAEATITKADPDEGHMKVGFDIVCYNQHGKEVLRGKTNGIIRL